MISARIHSLDGKIDGQQSKLPLVDPESCQEGQLLIGSSDQVSHQQTGIFSDFRIIFIADQFLIKKGTSNPNRAGSCFQPFSHVLHGNPHPSPGANLVGENSGTSFVK